MHLCIPEGVIIKPDDHVHDPIPHYTLETSVLLSHGLMLCFRVIICGRRSVAV